MHIDEWMIQSHNNKVHHNRVNILWYCIVQVARKICHFIQWRRTSVMLSHIHVNLTTAFSGWQQTNKTKLLCEGIHWSRDKFSVTGAKNAERISMAWHHHVEEAKIRLSKQVAQKWSHIGDNTSNSYDRSTVWPTECLDVQQQRYGFIEGGWGPSMKKRPLRDLMEWSYTVPSNV